MIMKRLSALDKELQDGHFRVSLFGSARIKKGDAIYTLVHNLAQAIGKEGIDIVTGGGPGLMNAASEGHAHGRKDKSVRSLGLLIKLPHEKPKNKHLDFKEEFNRFTPRLDHFMVLSNAVVVAPGGLGTLLELFYTWQLVQLGEVCDMPIILLGKQWKPLLNWVKQWPLKQGFMSLQDMHSVFHANTVNDAMKIIKKTQELYVKGGKNVCLNIQKYGL